MSTTAVSAPKDPKKRARTDLRIALASLGMALGCTLSAYALHWAGLYYFGLPVFALCSLCCNRLSSWGLHINRAAAPSKAQRPVAVTFHLVIWLCFIPGLLLTAFLDYPIARAYKMKLIDRLEPAIAYAKNYAAAHQGQTPDQPGFEARFPGSGIRLRYCPDGNMLLYLEHHPAKEIKKYLAVDLRDGIWDNLDTDDIKRYRERDKRPEGIERWMACDLSAPQKSFQPKEQP